MRHQHSNWRLHMQVVVLFLASLAAGGCRPSAVPEVASRDRADVDRLLHLMQQRLTLMDDVARWKWTAGQPITDPKRERELLERVVERGRDKGLDPELVRRFFAAQMEAARALQQAKFDRWSADKQKPIRTRVGRVATYRCPERRTIDTPPRFPRPSDPSSRALRQHRRKSWQYTGPSSRVGHRPPR